MKNLTINKKLYLSFSAVVVLMMIMGGIAVYQLSNIS